MPPESHDDWSRARHLIEEYAASLDVDLSFQNLDRELAHLESEYAAPTGAFLLAEENGDYVGCVGVRQLAADTGEIKRLYVRPSLRKRGVGRLLVTRIVAAAKALGYMQLRLDTLPHMEEAQSLYTSSGFKPIVPYRFNPVPGTVFLELTL
jgi:putative acetyltransferase